VKRLIISFALSAVLGMASALVGVASLAVFQVLGVLP
jgi:hypothetical protein